MKGPSLFILLLSLLNICTTPDTRAAAAPTLTGKWVIDMLTGAGSGFLAGRIEWAVDTFVFRQSSTKRNETLTATPGLETSAGTYTSTTQIGSSATSQSFSTSADERYGRCTMDVARIAWNPDTQQYQSISQQSYHAYQFNPNMAGINTAPRTNGQHTGSGYWLIYGVSEKVENVGHKIASEVSGDRSLAAHGSFSYPATVRYKLSDLAFRNSSWAWVPRTNDDQKSVTIGATGPSSSTVSLLEANTKLHSERVNGGSRLSWSKVPGTAVNMAIPVGTPTPIPISIPVKAWTVSQQTW